MSVSRAVVDDGGLPGIGVDRFGMAAADPRLSARAGCGGGGKRESQRHLRWKGEAIHPGHDVDCVGIV
jgi:hypothetical protein